MISREHRFHGPNGLKAVYHGGQTVRGSFLALRHKPNRDGNGYHAAVVVSKKVHKSAVKRNRVRRRIYAIIGEQQAATTTPHDFIITVFSDQIITWPPTRLNKEIISLFKKAGIIKTER